MVNLETSLHQRPGASVAGRRLPSREAVFCSCVCAALILLIVIAQYASTFVLPPAVPAHVTNPPLEQRSYIDHGFVWDARWYDSIARHGYMFPADANHASNAAFFPLWPLILHSVYSLFGAGEVRRAFVLLLAAAIACASIVAFHRLASAVMQPAGARFATLLYAFNPAAHFMFQSYPVGLINLLVILALDAVVDRRFWRAAVLSGAASAAGPLGALLAPAVVLAALWDRPRGAVVLGGLSVVCVSGLMFFIAWQYFWLDAPFAFAAAQDSWMRALPFSDRVGKFIYFEVFPLDFRDAWRDGLKAWHFGQAMQWKQADGRLEGLLGSVGIGLSLAGTLSAAFVRPRWLAFFAWSVISAYIWLIATNVDSQAALRHIYVAVPALLGLARVVYWSPWLARVMLGFSVSALVGEVMLTYRGYWVV